MWGICDSNRNEILQRLGKNKSQMVEQLPVRRLSPKNFSVFPDNPAGESLFVKDMNSDFYSEKKGNGKRKLCNF